MILASRQAASSAGHIIGWSCTAALTLHQILLNQPQALLVGELRMVCRVCYKMVMHRFFDPTLLALILLNMAIICMTYRSACFACFACFVCSTVTWLSSIHGSCLAEHAVTYGQ